jgi:hypothetical protein
MPRRTARTPRPELTAEQQAGADRIHAAVLDAAAEDLRELAELLATKDDTNTFGATEFTVRDIVLRVGAKAIQTALEERKKGGTTGPAEPAPAATKRPSSSAGRPKRS